MATPQHRASAASLPVWRKGLTDDKRDENEALNVIHGQWKLYDRIESVFSRKEFPKMGLNGAVCTSQALATQVGISILQQGGNAADAAVAVAAVLGVTEPASTGLGGDCFAIWYDAKTRMVQGLNGSGRSAAGIDLSKISGEHILSNNDGRPTGLAPQSAHCVTVPGTADGWLSALEKWGSSNLSVLQILQPAIDMAEHGFPVSVVSSAIWNFGSQKLRGPGRNDLLVNGERAPLAGEIFRNPSLGRTMRRLADFGRAGFYESEIADSIADAVAEFGGSLSRNDLRQHVTTFPKPITINYKGIDVHEIPPNGQGLAVLIALNILQQIQPPISSYRHNSVEHWHVLIECMRLAFADTRVYVADLDHEDGKKLPITQLLSAEYGKQRAALFRADVASTNVVEGSPIASSDTVSFVVVDKDGNACSFINSTYMAHGSGIVPKGCGFSLQNRGANFSLDPRHANRLAPNKRPFHTIIPGMCTKDGLLWSPFNVMGGFMQPQGHMQILVHQIDFNLDPQAALDQPRFCLDGGDAAGHVLLESGVPADVVKGLRSKGHSVQIIDGIARTVFGRGQIVRRLENGVLVAGTDARADGQSAVY